MFRWTILLDDSGPLHASECKQYPRWENDIGTQFQRRNMIVLVRFLSKEPVGYDCRNNCLTATVLGMTSLLDILDPTLIDYVHRFHLAVGVVSSRIVLDCKQN